MRTTSRCLALVVAILSSGLPIMAQAQRKTDATRILNNMFRVYSRLASYQDEGMATIQTPQGRFEQHAFIASHYPLVCMVAYTDITKNLLVASDVDGFFEAVRDQFIREVGGKLASESSLSLDGYPGREIKAHMFRGELRLRLFLVGDRLYQLSLINMGKADEEAFTKFFVSLKLTPITKPIAAVAGSNPVVPTISINH